jgi:poly-gamma-glutamate synthase PgsB/CapB
MFSVILSLLLIIYGLIEYIRHIENRDTLRLVVDVNGSRGKSSVTRLIAGALRESGKRTVAKVTGTNPRLIDTDGNDYIIDRPTGHPSVLEQLMLFKFAREQKAEAAVIECMALLPDHQKVDVQISRPNISVITNVRTDHMDMMGPRIDDVAHSLSKTIVRNGIVVTSEQVPERQEILRKRAEELNSKFFAVSGKTVTDEMMKPFPYLEHRENVAIVLEVCRQLGIPQEVALRGMHKTHPDDGVLRTHMFLCGEKRVEFINALAANDPESLSIIWKRMQVRYSSAHTRITLVNSRRERMHRSLQLCRFVHDELYMDYLILTGDDTHLIRATLILLGVKPEKILDLNHLEPNQVIDKVVGLVERDGAVFAIGNIGGMGEKIVSVIKERCILK